MPVYEYFCTKCKMGFEFMRPFSESDKDAVCPNCNSKAQKLVSSFGSKTGSYIQASSKPFRKATGEKTKEMKKSGKAKRRRAKHSQ
jgi:putative FmdB family regulatory protein